MLSSAEAPRPLPPAKARRATMLKLSSTPPPAYNSPFTFPSRRQSRQDILGAPMDATFHMIGWDSDSAQTSSSSPLTEEHDWMKEKSRKELEDLLVTANHMIKERELGLSSFDDVIGVDDLPLFFSIQLFQNLILAQRHAGTCTGILLLSSRNMRLCYPRFLALLHLLLTLSHICYPEP